jgi:regulator of sigma E protease
MFTPDLTQLTLILKQLFFILLGFFGMGFLVGFHELGHFLFAKLFKIRIPSFSLGFGPVLFNKKIGETDFCLSAIPFGGYVEIAGAAEVGQGDQKEALATDAGSFATKPFYQQLLVMLGGIIFNLAFAYFAMILLFTAGIPKTPIIPSTSIATVRAGSPAELAGLEKGDHIIAVQNQNTENSPYKFQALFLPLLRVPISLTIDRQGERLTKTVLIETQETNAANNGILGVEFDITSTPPHNFIDAAKKGIQLCNQWIKNTFAGFSTLFSKQGVKQIAGPVAIIGMMVKGAATGWQIFMLLLAIISINLAVLNLIPLPILDGGQILFYGIEALIRRPLPHKIREYIHIATWIMFIILFIYLTTQDISRIVSPYVDSVIKYFKSTPQ